MVSVLHLFTGQTSSEEIAALPFAVLVDGYLRYYAAGAGHTARAKRLDLAQFVRFLAEFRCYATPAKLTVRDWDFAAVQRFVDDRLAAGEAPATVARRLATLKHMGRTLAEKVAGFVNPARDVKAPKLAPLKPQALTERDIAAARQKARERCAEKSSFIRFRNAALFNFLLDTGLRADEVRRLKLGQIDPHGEWIRNVRTKGRRFRNVYITSEMRADLTLYLEARTTELARFYTKLTPAQNAALPLFISTYGAVPGEPDTFAMGAKSIWRAMRELSVGTPIHPHLLRHSFAIDLLADSNDVRLVAQALGHSDVRITMRYTERVDEQVAVALERSRSKKRRTSSAR